VETYQNFQFVNFNFQLKKYRGILKKEFFLGEKIEV